MNDFLLLVISLSLSGALLTLLLAALRPLFKHLSRTWQYYIWLLVILRLLIPWSPEVNLVGGLFQQAEAYWTEQNVPVEETALAVYDEAAAQDAAANTPMRKLVSLHGWGALWLAIALGLIIRKLIGYRRFTGAVKQSCQMATDEAVLAVLQTVETELGLRRKAAVGVAPLVKAPLLVGSSQPLIVLPDAKLAEADLANIFRHELSHFQRGDILYKWLTELALCLHWFNPVVYWVRRQINRDCELACDEAVIAQLTPAARQRYGQTLLSAVRPASSSAVQGMPLALGADGRLLKDRLLAILAYQPQSKGTICLTAALTPFLFCGMLLSGAYTLPALKQTAVSAEPALLSSESTVVYEQVELRCYEGKDSHPYIHNSTTNNTTQDIVSFKRGMLAFDQSGEPLAIDWFSIDSDVDKAYFYLYETDALKLTAGSTEDVYGGWSLNLKGTDSAVKEIAYVLYCDQEITFADGTVWRNPDFDSWRAAYAGQKTDVHILETYYPYIQKIVL